MSGCVQPVCFTCGWEVASHKEQYVRDLLERYGTVNNSTPRDFVSELDLKGNHDLLVKNGAKRICCQITLDSMICRDPFVEAIIAKHKAKKDVRKESR